MMKQHYYHNFFKSLSLISNYHKLVTKADSIGDFTREIAEQAWVKKNMEIAKFVNRFLKLTEKYSATDMENACKRAYFYNCYDYKSLHMILKNGLHKLPVSYDTDLFGQCKFPFL